MKVKNERDRRINEESNNKSNAAHKSESIVKYERK